MKGLLCALALATAAIGTAADQYVIKTNPYPLSDIAFRVFLNGEEVGTFDAKGETEITGLVKRGRNVLKVTIVKTGPRVPDLAKASITIGRKSGARWNTIMNVVGTKASVGTSRTLRFVAN